MRVAFDEERLEHGHIARGDRTHRSEVEDLQLTVYAQLTISVVWVENKFKAWLKRYLRVKSSHVQIPKLKIKWQSIGLRSIRKKSLALQFWLYTALYQVW